MPEDGSAQIIPFDPRRPAYQARMLREIESSSSGTDDSTSDRQDRGSRR